jgi:hypothetical protein
LSKDKWNKSAGELFSEISEFGFHPGIVENAGLFTVELFVSVVILN